MCGKFCEDCELNMFENCCWDSSMILRLLYSFLIQFFLQLVVVEKEDWSKIEK